MSDKMLSTEQKLQAMLDRDEIWQVLLRYSRGQDRSDRELVRSCYFDDAVDDHLGMFVGDPDAFIDWAFGEQEERFVAFQHRLSNFSCELTGDDDAHSETYFQFVGFAHMPPHILSIGRYIDHFQRRNGEWRIATRVCVSEGRFELAGLAADAVTSDGVTTHTVSRNRDDVSYQRPLHASGAAVG